MRNSTDGKKINRKNKEKIQKTREREREEKFIDKIYHDEGIGHTRKTSDLFTCALLDRLLP